MKTFSAALVLVMLTGTAAFAQQPMSPAQSTTTGPAIPSFSETLLSVVPGNSVTVTDWYKQTIYDPSDAKIGDIKDVLIDQNGKISALIVGVGNFLGGEKDVAVSFNAIKMTQKNGKNVLIMNTTKDDLKTTVGYKYDRQTMTWLVDSSCKTITCLNSSK
jgi:sporulation protein YlmC with PRC-barrel domain